MTSGKNADPRRIIEKIHAIEEEHGVNSDAARPRNLDWNDPDHRAHVRRKFEENGGIEEALLPGFGPEGRGENAHDDCGNPHPFVCDECGNSVEFGRTCAQSVCARCGAAWARDTAINKSAKIRRLRKEKHHHTPDNEHQKLHHLTISARLEWYYTLARAGLSYQDAKEKTREVAKLILDELRAPGLLVRHGFRGEKDDGTIASEDDDRGKWKERLNSDREWVGDVRDQLAWNPHYHAFVAGDYIRTSGFTDKLEAKTGWVVHRIAGDDGISLPSDGAMARAVTYSLSHANIQVRDGPNRSAVWEVGTFDGDIFRSSSRFVARPHDLEWADGYVREISGEVLGLKSGTTDCGADLPAVDDPDELARRILEELYPDHDADVSTDRVLSHVEAGNLTVDVSTTAGGGGSVTVRDAFGEPVGAGGWGSPGDLPATAGGAVAGDGGAEAVRTVVDDATDSDDCGCGDDHDHADDDGTCDGRLIPLEEARQRGLLDDEEWRQSAPFVDDADATDREWPDDLDPWRTSSPGDAIGAG